MENNMEKNTIEYILSSHIIPKELSAYYSETLIEIKIDMNRAPEHRLEHTGDDAALVAEYWAKVEEAREYYLFTRTA